jgi:hypothetical protein
MNTNEPWVITPTSLSKRCDRVTLYRFGRDTFSIVTVQQVIRPLYDKLGGSAQAYADWEMARRAAAPRRLYHSICTRSPYACACNTYAGRNGVRPPHTYLVSRHGRW